MIETLKTRSILITLGANGDCPRLFFNSPQDYQDNGIGFGNEEGCLCCNGLQESGTIGKNMLHPACKACGIRGAITQLTSQAYLELISQ